MDYLPHLPPNDESLILTKADLLDALSQQFLNVTARNNIPFYGWELRTQDVR